MWAVMCCDVMEVVGDEKKEKAFRIESLVISLGIHPWFYFFLLFSFGVHEVESHARRMVRYTRGRMEINVCKVKKVAMPHVYFFFPVELNKNTMAE